jgi:adenosylhomocysteine nucleosidase
VPDLNVPDLNVPDLNVPDLNVPDLNVPDLNVVVLAPMPLEMDAIVRAFGLSQTADDKDAPWSGHIGRSDVTAIHIGMGPPLTRVATNRLFDSVKRDQLRVDHVMIAGICGGLDPEIEVGTLINPEFVVDFTTGTSYRHVPPGSSAQTGKLMTTEGVTLDSELSAAFLADGFIGVDMETAAVAEVCEAHGCPWSVFRCIGDRHFDGLLDERIFAATNPDGSGNMAEIERLIASDPGMVEKLQQLGQDTTRAARLAAEAAARACAELAA